MPSRYDIARRLYGAHAVGAGTGTSVSVASAGGVSGNGSSSLTMRYGTATADSADGWVTVRLDTSGTVTEGSDVRCSCDSPISEGQRVQVLYSSTGALVAIPIGDNIAKDAIVSAVQQYAEGTDGTNAPESGWSTSWPRDADWVWARSMYTRNDGSVEYSTPWLAKEPPDGYENDATVYATSSTAAGTAAKVATVTDGSALDLKSGTVVAVTFTYWNTASSPTLNVGGTGAKPVYTNGTRYAYWAAGATVLFLYDGSAWQVCSTPVYASTVTVGNPGSKNMYIDGTHVAVRNGTTEYATFSNQEIHLGLGTVTSGLFLADDTIKMQAVQENNGYNTFEIRPMDGSSNTTQMMVGIGSEEGYLAFTRTGNPSYPWMTTLSALSEMNIVTDNGDTAIDTGTLNLCACDAIYKPFITCGATSSDSALKSLTSSNTVMPLNATWSNEYSSTATSGPGVRIYRSGNYVYVTVPTLRNGGITVSNVDVEVSAYMTFIGVDNSNIGSGVQVSRYSGNSGTPSATQIDAGLVTTDSDSKSERYATTVLTPYVLRLPRTSSNSYAYTRYRLNLFARSTNSTGGFVGATLTVKLL